MSSEGYPGLKLKEEEYHVPLSLEAPDQIPVDFESYNRELLRTTLEISEASNRHLHYSLLKAQHIGRYEVDFHRAYAKHAGLDLNQPLHKQRDGKRSKMTVKELEAAAAEDMGERYIQIMTISLLVDAWEARVKALSAQLTALQSCSANLRAEEAMSRVGQPR